jgi:hypothetical protein
MRPISFTELVTKVKPNINSSWSSSTPKSSSGWCAGSLWLQGDFTLYKWHWNYVKKWGVLTLNQCWFGIPLMGIKSGIKVDNHDYPQKIKSNTQYWKIQLLYIALVFFFLILKKKSNVHLRTATSLVGSFMEPSGYLKFLKYLESTIHWI